METQTTPGSSDRFKKKWARAAAAFEESQRREGRKIKLDFKKSIQSGEDVINLIRTSDRNFRAADIPEAGKLSNALSAFVSPLTAMISMFGGMAGAAYPPASQILGAVSFVVNVVKEKNAAMEALAGLFERLGNATNRLQVTQDEPSEYLEDIAVGILVCLLSILDLAARRKTRPKDGDLLHRLKAKVKDDSKEFSRILLWSHDDEINGAIAKLDSLTETELHMTAALTKQDTTAIRRSAIRTEGLSVRIEETAHRTLEFTMDMNDKVSDISGKMSKLATADNIEDSFSRSLNKFFGPRQQDAKRKVEENKVSRGESGMPKRLQACLKPSFRENREVFDKLKKEWIQGAADWILKEAQVATWLERKGHGIALITGPPGSGKTFLASRIVDLLLSDPPQAGKDASRTYVAYFFCKDRLSNLSSVATVLKTLAYQIALDDLAYAKRITDLAERDDLPDSDVAELWKLLFSNFFLETRGTAYIVVDSLDECEAQDVQNLWNALKEHFAPPTPGEGSKLNLLFLLGPEGASTMTTTLEKDLVSRVVLDASQGVAGFCDFVRQRSRKALSESMVPPHLLREIRETVVEVSKGNYLHALLTIDRIASLSREDRVRDFLANPPLKLEDAVRYTLTRLTKDMGTDERVDFEDILAWVTCSETDLNLAQLDALLALRGAKASRIINLEKLLRDDYTSLYIVSGAPASFKTSKQLSDSRLKPLDTALVEEDTEEDSPMEPKSNDPAHRAFGGFDELTDEEQEGAFKARRSAMERANIRLEHGLLAQFIENEQLDRGAVRLTKDQMRCTTLLRCLEIATDPPETADQADVSTAMEYVAQNVYGHVTNTKPATGDVATKLAIAQALLHLLRDSAAIDRWIEKGGYAMTANVLGNDSFLASARAWMQDPDVKPQLATEDQSLVELAAEQSVKDLAEALAHRHANRWLTQKKEDFADSFEFLNTYLRKVTAPIVASKEAHDVAQKTTVLEEGASPLTKGDLAGQGTDNADANRAPPSEPSECSPTVETNNTDETKQDADAPKESEGAADSSLFSASEERIIEVARWVGLEENAMWHARVAAALSYADKYGASIRQYRKALEMEPTNGFFHEGLAHVHIQLQDTKGAIEMMEKAVAVLSSHIRTLEPGSEARTEADVRLASCRDDLAWYYIQDKRQRDAIKTLEDLLTGWESEKIEEQIWQLMCFNAVYFMRVLARWKMWDAALALLERIINHPKRASASFLNVYGSFGYGDLIVARVSYHSKRFGLADRFWVDAVQFIAQHGEPGDTARMRFNRACAMLRLQPRRPEAITLLEAAMDDREAVESAFGSPWWLGEMKVELARKYMDNILAAREKPRWTLVGEWAHRLVSLIQDIDDTDDAETTTPTSKQPHVLTLAAWDRISGRKQHAKLLIKERLTDGVDILTNEDEEDDYEGWSSVGNALLAVGDIDRARGAISMIRLWYRSLQEKSAVASEKRRREAMAEIEADDTEGGQSTTISGPDESQAQAGGNDSTTAGSDRPDQAIGPTSGTSTTDAASSPTLDSVAGADASSSVNPPEVEVKYNGWYSCEGPCGEDIQDTDTLWRCSYCISDFCEACHQLVVDKKTEHWGLCNYTHEHVEFYGVNEKWPKGQLRVGEDFVPMKQWLEELMEEYGIEKKSSAAVEAKDDQKEKSEDVNGEKSDEKGDGVTSDKKEEEKTEGTPKEEETVAGASEQPQ